MQDCSQVDPEMIAPLLLIDTAGCDMEETASGAEESKSNRSEAGIAMLHCQRLQDAGVKLRDIGIITPYNAQVYRKAVPRLSIRS